MNRIVHHLLNMYLYEDFFYQNSFCAHCNCNFIHQVASARRQQKDLSVFESSCNLPTYLPHTAEASYCPFNCGTSSREAVNTNFCSLSFDPTGNRTQVYRFSSRRSMHSTTDRFYAFQYFGENHEKRLGLARMNVF